MSDEELKKEECAEPVSETPAPDEAEQAETTPAEESASQEPDPETEAAPAEPETKPSEAEVLKGRLLRLQADFDNYRKRVARDHAELVAQASSDVLKAMLPPMDHLEMAIESMAKNAGEEDPMLKGVRMVRDELLAAFDRFALKPIDTQVGAELDPNAEEALGILPMPGIEENRIAVVVRKGYTLHGKVLRAAQVMVGAGTPAAPAAPEATDVPPETDAPAASGEED